MSETVDAITALAQNPIQATAEVVSELTARIAELERERDDPNADGTDAAHPAWWRGQRAGAESICREVNAILDGQAAIVGVCNEPWESTRRRVAELTAKLDTAERERERAARLAQQAADFLFWFNTDGSPCDGFRFRADRAKLESELRSMGFEWNQGRLGK